MKSDSNLYDEKSKTNYEIQSNEDLSLAFDPSFMSFIRNFDLWNAFGLTPNQSVSEQTEILGNLQKLVLDGQNEISDRELVFIGKLHSLQELSLEHCWEVASSGLKYLSELEKLESLNLRGNWHVDDTGLHWLPALKKLRKLNLNDCKITNEGVPLLAKLPCLEFLDLSFNNDVNELTPLAELPRLRELHIPRATQESLEILSKQLPHLRAFSLGWTENQSLEFLARWTELETLYVYCESLKNEDLSFLDSLRHLKSLSLAPTGQLTCMGILNHLSPQVNLVELDLNLQPVGHEAMSWIAKHPRLQNLRLGNDVTDEDLRFLSAHADLRFLDLRDCSQLTDTAIQQLKQLLPNCDICTSSL